MFRTSQIINATQLTKHFKKVSKYLASNPEPILITKKNQPLLVFVPADLFEDLATQRLERDGVIVPPSYSRAEIMPSF